MANSCDSIDSSLQALAQSQSAKILALEARLNECCARIDTAATAANQALQIALAVQSAAAQIGTQVANLIATVALTIGLSGRVDALEAGQNLLSNDLSKVLTLITALDNAFQKALWEREAYLVALIGGLVARLRFEINEVLEFAQKCCKKIDDFLDPSNPNSPNNPMNQQCCNDIKNGINAINGKLDNLNANVVQQGLPALPGILQTLTTIGSNILKLLEMFNTITNAIQGIKNIVDLIKGFLGIKDDGSPNPNNPLNPAIFGSLSVTDCSGTKMVIPYGGDGFQGLQSMINAQTTLLGNLNTTNCELTNPQGFINTRVCGKNFVVSFKGANEGIQKLGDLIGGGFNEICRGINDTIDTIDDPTQWRFRLNPYMKDLMDEYNPTVSGTISGTLCNGSVINAGYSGKGFNGINSALKAQSFIDDRVLQDLLVCISNLINPNSNKYNGAFVGIDCDGKAIDVKYTNADLTVVLQALFMALQQQSTTLCVKTQGSYTGGFQTIDCDGKVIRNGYVQANLEQVLQQLFLTLDEKLLSLCPLIGNASNFTDCEGKIFTPQFSGYGLKGIERGIFAYAKTTELLIQSLCKKLDADLPQNNPNVSGSLGISSCGVTDIYSYGVPRNQELLTNIRGATLLIGKVLDKVCQRLDPDIGGGSILQDCEGNVLTALFQGKGLPALADGISQHTVAIALILRQICQKLDLPISGTVNKIICGETLNVNYGGVGLLGVVSAVNAQAQIQQRAIDVVCKEVQENMCTVLEPSEENAERNLVTQMMIRFVPKGTTNFKGVSAWRLHIPNPKPGLTCADLAPLTWTKGRWVGKILFNNGFMNTWSYFNSEAEAERVMLHLASLSTDPLKQPEPRVTKNGSPKRTPVVVEVVPWYAVITTLSNGQVTDTRCIKCLP